MPGEDTTVRVGQALRRFVVESNRIEGIERPPTEAEISAHAAFMSLRRVTVKDLEGFVAMVAGRPLRRALGQNVRVGSHLPPPGGPEIERRLEHILAIVNTRSGDPYAVHVSYELLHPFLDGNGRSGRVLWAWHMSQIGRDPFSLPFLHRFYYQALDAARLIEEA